MIYTIQHPDGRTQAFETKFEKEDFILALCTALNQEQHIVTSIILADTEAEMVIPRQVLNQLIFIFN